MEKNIKEVFLSAGKTFFFKIFGLIANYIVLLYITNKYGSTIFGRYSLLVFLTNIVGVLFSLGFPISVISMLSDKNHFEDIEKSDFLNKKINILLIIGSFISTSLYFSSELISYYILNDLTYSNSLKKLSFFVLPIIFYNFFLGFFKGIKEYLKHNFFLFILPPILLMTLCVVFKEYSELEPFNFFLYSLFIVFLLQAYFFLRIKKENNSNLQIISKKKILKLSLPMMYSGLLLFLLSSTDIFMIQILRTSKEVGIYNGAFKIASISFVFINVINVVIAPKISELFHMKKISEIHKIIVKTTRLIILLTFPVSFIIFFFNKEILSVLGSDFTVGHLTLNYLLLGILLNAVCGTVDQVLNMTNNQIILRNVVVVSFFLNIILNYILIPMHGIDGAAIASLITNVFLNFLCVYYIKKKLGFFTFL